MAIETLMESTESIASEKHVFKYREKLKFGGLSPERPISRILHRFHITPYHGYFYHGYFHRNIFLQEEGCRLTS